MLKTGTEEYEYQIRFFKIFGTRKTELSQEREPDILVFETEDDLETVFSLEYQTSYPENILQLVISVKNANLIGAETLQDYVEYFKQHGRYYTLSTMENLLKYNKLIKRNLSEFMYEILKLEHLQSIKDKLLTIASSFGFIDEAYLLSTTT